MLNEQARIRLHSIVPGALVWYHPDAIHRWPAVVTGAPRFAGGCVYVVPIRVLPCPYGARDLHSVLWECLEPRVEVPIRARREGSAP